MSVNLTANAIPAIINGDVNAKPLLQILEISSVISNKNSQQQRYRVLLSDAVSSHHAMLAAQLNDLVTTGRVKNGSIVQLLDYICTLFQNRKYIFLPLVLNFPLDWEIYVVIITLRLFPFEFNFMRISLFMSF